MQQSEGYSRSVETLLQHLLTNETSWKEAMNLYTRLRQSGKFNVIRLVPIVLDSRTSEKNLGEILDTILQTDQERAEFFVNIVIAI